MFPTLLKIQRKADFFLYEEVSSRIIPVIEIHLQRKNIFIKFFQPTLQVPQGTFFSYSVSIGATPAPGLMDASWTLV